MSIEDRRAQQILRAYGGWMLTDILCDPDAGISSARTSFYGCTHYVVNGEAYFMQTTGKGIQLGRHLDDPREILPWAQIKRMARAVDPFLRVRIEEQRRLGRLHARGYPRFEATGEAIGCGRHVVEGPATRGQALYGEQYDAWEASGVVSRWVAQREALEDEQERLLDQALPLAATTAEPTDLLELLALGGAA
jgi:hypothetical protein